MRYQIALVEDEPLYQKIVSERITTGLEAQGCTCTVRAFDCDDDLLEAMHVQPFDAFFLDIAVREYNGIRLAQKLRKMGVAAPIIFVSAMESDVFEAFRVQPLGFIRKSAQTRLYMAATMRQDPTTTLPTNLGDVLYPSDFGMRYGENADIDLNTLVMDQVVEEQEVESSWGTSVQNVVVNKTVTAGESFPIYMIAENAGSDGTVMAQVYDGDDLIASQLVSVEGGSFTVVTINITLEDVGEHVLSVGENTLTVTVA